MKKIKIEHLEYPTIKTGRCYLEDYLEDPQEVDNEETVNLWGTY
jgi:hypothetical protein